MPDALAPMTTPLSADLGRLALPARAAPLEAERLALLDRLIQADARGELHHAEWEAAFADSAAAIRDLVMARAEEAVHAGAASSRYPGALLRDRLPGSEAAEALLHRLLACAMSVEALAGHGEDASTRRARGAALEGAWEAAMAVAAAEGAVWERRAQEIARWRRPIRPRVLTMAGLTAGLVVLAGWLGGQFPSPGWFEPVHTAFWSLPWP